MSESLKEFLEIQKQFLIALPLKNFEWFNVFDSLKCNVKLQERLLDMTVRDSTVLKFPIKVSYQKIFLKHIISELEAGEGCDICDDVYDIYCKLVSHHQKCNTTHFRHYMLPPGRGVPRLVLKESTNLVSQGSTGLSSWQAGLTLAEWCLGHDWPPDCLVLELGSGCGLAGLVAAVSSRSAQVVLSDCHEAVLEQLRANVQLNVDASSGEKMLDGTRLSVQALPWAEVATKWDSTKAPHFILAADVVFDPSLFADLRDALVFLLSLPPHHGTALLACTMRNESTLQDFLTLLAGNSDIDIEQDSSEVRSVFYYDKSAPVIIYKLKYRPKPAS